MAKNVFIRFMYAWPHSLVSAGHRHATDAPVLILKSCIGNRSLGSLGWDLLPPGSPSFEFEEKGKIWHYAGYNRCDADELLAVLQVDQEHRWRTGDPLNVEDHLNRIPELAKDSNINFRLVVGEFQARQKGDTAPSIDDFTSRFADLGETLRTRLTELVAEKKEINRLSDATWLHTFSNTNFWTTAGGGFNAVASASQIVDNVGFYTWNAAPLTSDVQFCLDKYFG